MIITRAYTRVVIGLYIYIIARCFFFCFSTNVKKNDVHYLD